MPANGKPQQLKTAQNQESLRVFEFEANQVRTITIGDEPWFVAVDVATVLGFDDSNRMTRLLSDDEKQTPHNMGGLTNSRNTAVTLINEPGLYKAIFRSRKPEAEAFKNWVTHKVLPSIRKTGSYALPAPQQPALPDFTNPAEAARAWATQYEAKEKLAFRASSSQTQSGALRSSHEQ